MLPVSAEIEFKKIALEQKKRRMAFFMEILGFLSANKTGETLILQSKFCGVLHFGSEVQDREL